MNTMNITINGVTYNEVPENLCVAMAQMLQPYAPKKASPKGKGKTTTTTTKAKPSTAKKPVATKKPAQPKAEDTFDRDKYEATAKQLGCYGKRGVWKCCRPTVYAVMDGTMTLANGKKAVAKVKKDNGWA